MRGLYFDRWPPRLRVGVLLLVVLAGISLFGPWFVADPARIVDARAAGLLAPGTRRFVLTLDDGSTLAAEGARSDGAHWSITRLGMTQTIETRRVVHVEVCRFVLGTDRVGRDVLARIVSGGRVSLAVGSLALLVAVVFGVGVGIVAGWNGGIIDAVLMRIVDGMLAVPMLFLLLLLAAVFRPSFLMLVLVLGFSSWMGVARLARGQVLTLREREFVLAARGIGASPLRIALVHLLPNAVTPLAQDAALRLGDLILIETALSFLGLGVQPPMPSWGNIVAEGGDVLASAWWLTFPPGIAVAATVIGAAFFADGLRELARGELQFRTG